MLISKINYYTYSWATTNPPRNESTELTLTFVLGVMGMNDVISLVRITDNNGEKSTKACTPTRAQYDELVKLVEDNDVINSIIAQLKAPPAPPVPELCGGGGGSTFTICANGVELSTNRLEEGVSAVVRKMQEIFGSGMGEWSCPQCGYAPNKGDYCINCGLPRA